jgi:uncharacterized protein (TIGR02246 family)
MSERPDAYDTSGHEHDIRQIHERIAELEAGQNANDPARIGRPFAADILFVTASGMRLLDWNEMHALHRRSVDDAPDGRSARFSVLDLRFLTPDVAVAHTRQDYLPPESGSNHGTVVLAKKNGAWWICAMQHTNVRAEQTESR